MLQSINPSTGEVVKEFKELSEHEVEGCIAKSTAAFEKWRLLAFEKRAAYFKKAAKLLLKNKSQYARIMALEMGKPITQGISEIEKCAWVCSYYSENAEKFLKDDVVKTEHVKSYVRFEPLGPVLGVMPWNFPFWQCFRACAPAMMAGNTFLLKHASNVPQCALEIEKLFKAAGFPRDVFKTLLVGSSMVEPIIADERVKGVTLTGSEFAGRKVAEAAGRNLKKAVLELGGSDAFIVLEDADVRKCAATACDARFMNAGQSCISPKRFIVVEKVYNAFRKELFAAVRKLKVGDPFDAKTQAGPMAREDLLQQLDRQVKDSFASGAIILYGGRRLHGSGSFYMPTILENVTKGMPAFDEELFGPVAVMIKAKNAEHAVKLANDHCYGLGASIWTRNLKKGEELAKKIEAGVVFVNHIVRSDPRLPFGGVKHSGYGRELGSYGIKEFCNVKSVVVDKFK